MMANRDEAHMAVAIAIAERLLCQPRDMAWEQKCDELASAAIEGLQLHFEYLRQHAKPLPTPPTDAKGDV